MGRTMPSFSIAAGMEKRRWKTFRQELDKSERKGLMRRCLIHDCITPPVCWLASLCYYIQSLCLLISALQEINKYSDRTRINQILLFIKSIIESKL